jgi:hypothetical protein
MAISVLILNSCGKDPIAVQQTENSQLESSPLVNEILHGSNEYMENLPQFDLSELPEVMKKMKEAHTKVAAVWGIGSDNKVWKWNGSSWDQPNSAARLEFVDVSEYGGGVWGTGSDQRIYKWNGSSWAEPNASARLYKVVAFDGTTALGIGGSGTLFITTNGGASWAYFTSITNVIDVSVGNTVNNFCWIVQLNSGTYKLYNYDYPTSSWIYRATPNVPRTVAAIWAGGAWYLMNNGYSIYRTTSNSGSFTQPNSSAGLLQISAYGDDLNAWGIGTSNRIFRTVNGGTSWTEPNTAARLAYVSCGYE